MFTFSNISLFSIFLTIDDVGTSISSFYFCSPIFLAVLKLRLYGDVMLNYFTIVLSFRGVKYLSFLFVVLWVFDSVARIFIYFGGSFFTLLLIYFAIYLIFASRTFGSKAVFSSLWLYGFNTETFNLYLDICFLIILTSGSDIFFLCFCAVFYEVCSRFFLTFTSYLSYPLRSLLSFLWLKIAYFLLSTLFFSFTSLFRASRAFWLL